MAARVAECPRGGCKNSGGACATGMRVLWKPRPEMIRAHIMVRTVYESASRAFPVADITSESRITGRRPILSDR